MDIVAENFWGRDRQCAFFDVRVFSPFAQSHRNTPLAQCYRRNEMEKRRQYDERVREIEHGSFSPLVFTTSGGMGTTATTVYKRIAAMVAEKHSKPYSRAMHWIRCRVSFSLLRSAIMCLRGSHVIIHRFIPKSVVNAQRFTSEAKDVILSLCKASFLYMGNFYVRCEEQSAPLVTPEGM